MATSDLLTDLAACLCAAFTPDGADTAPFCFCGVLPGQQAAADYMWACDSDPCGMAWVRLVQAYPSNGVGIVSQDPRNCASELGLDIEVGVLRCLEMGEAGEPPDPADMHQAAIQQAADMETARSAILCCDALEQGDYLLGRFQPHGPMGGIVGGAWTVYTAAA